MNYDRWRDVQLKGFTNLKSQQTILSQELVMLNFVKQFKDARWKWIAPQTSFLNICQQHIDIVDTDHNAVIVFGPPISNCDTAKLVQILSQLVQGVKYAYVAVNRYMITSNTLSIELPDSIEQSIDVVVKTCDPEFKRLARFDEVDGNHMVFAHPMDCFGLCR